MEARQRPGRTHPPHDIVAFVEDDCLLTNEAFSVLLDGASARDWAEVTREVSAWAQAAEPTLELST